jgi:transcriptional regulator with XRE-family HTH domain
MTGSELKALRKAKGWTARKMGLALGYCGKRNARLIYTLEERDTLPKEVEYRLAYMEKMQKGEF